MKRKMTAFDACMLIESGEASKKKLVRAVQFLIDNGMAWTLQGFYGRLATRMIEIGLCHR